MKYILLLLTLTFALAISNAQTKEVSLDISKLSPELLKEVEKQQATKAITEDLQQYGEWAGMGQEIGIAIKGGLSAITDEVAKVADTKVGKLTMFIIAWKVIGDDVKNLIIGPLMLILLTMIYLYLRWKWYGIKKIKIKDAVTKGYILKKITEPAEYEIFNPNKNNDDSFIAGKGISAIVYGIFMLVIVINIMN